MFFQTIENSDRRKKSTSNALLPSQSRKSALKQFQTSGKTQKKRNNYLKQLLQSNGQSTNKYRIVTQPVEQKMLYLGNFGNNPLGFSGSKPRLQSHQYAQRYLKLNIRNSPSKEKLKTGESFHKLESQGSMSCKNCEKYRSQLQSLKKQLNKICLDKVLWKNGQMHLEDIKQSFFKLHSQSKLQTSLNSQFPVIKTFEKQIKQMKKHIYDLMSDIDSISAIDYPKMLSLNVFRTDPFFMQSCQHQQSELKSLLSQLRNTLEGGVNQDELSDIFEYNCSNEYGKKIFRNLKTRLNHYLRENLQLKIRKQVLQRAQQITNQSEDYLKKVIHRVLMSYAQEAIE